MAEKILLVENEENIIEVLQKRFIKGGYEFFIAKTGEEGLRKMEEIKPDLVLLDLFLPQMSGFEVMERISKKPDLKKIPVFVISNSGRPEEINEAKELGAKDWIIKTEFDPQDIINKVTKQIGK